MKQEQVQKQKTTEKQPSEEDETEAVPDIRDETLSDDVDAILDEIDEVLEENATEFVANYIQKGGQ